MVITLKVNFSGYIFFYDWDPDTNQVSITQENLFRRIAVIYPSEFASLEPIIQTRLLCKARLKPSSPSVARPAAVGSPGATAAYAKASLGMAG